MLSATMQSPSMGGVYGFDLSRRYTYLFDYASSVRYTRSDEPQDETQGSSDLQNHWHASQRPTQGWRIHIRRQVQLHTCRLTGDCSIVRRFDSPKVS